MVEMKRLSILLLIALLFVQTASSFRPPVILLLGDSVTLANYTEKGFAHILQEQLAGRAIIINGGINGGTIQNALILWNQYAGSHPDLVIIYFGSNDIKHIRIGDESWEQLGAIFLKLGSLIPHPIFVIPHQGIETPSEQYYPADLVAVATYIHSLGYPLVDLYSVCCEPSQLSDYVHPNDEGHRIIANEILKTLYQELGP